MRERLLVDAAPPIVFHRELGLMFGIEGALFVQQLYYWSDKGTRDDGYIYKSKAEWEEETLISRYKQDKIVKELKKLGVLLTKVLKVNGVTLLHYKLEVGKVSNLLSGKRETYFRESKKPANEGIETETTTETTTDIDTIPQKAKTETSEGTPSAVAPDGATDDGDGTFPISSALQVAPGGAPDEVLTPGGRAPDPIASVIALFGNLNPTIYRLYANKTQRQAAQNLLKHHGATKVVNAVRFAESIVAETYAPVITTPLQLESKWGALQAYYLKKQSQNNQVTGKNYDE